MEGRFNQRYKLLEIIMAVIFVLGVFILCAINPTLMLVYSILFILLIFLFNNDDSSYKANNEVIKFRIYYLIKYSINIADITSLDIYPYTVHTRYGNNHRVMLTIDTEYKKYKFNNVLNVKTAIDNMFLEKPKIERPNEALTNLYYYIAEIRKNLNSEKNLMN